MKTCPNCQELLGDNITRCFSCKYDFELGRVPNEEDMKKIKEMQLEIQRQKEREEEERRILESRKRFEAEEEARKAEEIARRAEEEAEEIARKAEEEAIFYRAKNAYYEYDVVVLADDRWSGGFNVEKYTKILKQYAKEGWRLKTVFTNEAGKRSQTFGMGGNSVGTNATIEQTILTFERCIRPSQF